MRTVVLCFICLWGVPSYANEWVLSSTTPTLTDTLNIAFKIDKTQQGDLYLAVQIPNDKTFYFIDASLNLVGTPSAFKQNAVLNGTYPLFSLPVRTLPSGTYTLYAVSVNTGANPYDINNWHERENGLKQATFTVYPPENQENLDYLCTPPERWHAEMSHCMVM